MAGIRAGDYTRSCRGDDVTKWQPIETAPDDYKTIWVIGGMYEEPTMLGADGSFWRYELRQNPNLKNWPTHWTPLIVPDPPKAEQ